MGLLSRGIVSVAALMVFTTVAGCGGSVADADRAPRTRASTPPVSPFCAAAKANSDAIRPLNAMITQGNRDAEELSTTAEAVRRAGAELLSVTPGDIRADVERSVQSVNSQLDALLANGGDSAAVNRDPSLTAQLDAAELTAANQRVATYINDTCAVAR